MENVRRGNGTIWAMVAYTSLLVAPVFGQQLEREPRPAGEEKPRPYLNGSEVDFHAVLAQPPAAGSVRDHEDVLAVTELQKVPKTRWHSAELDNEFVYPRFDEAFGRPMDRKTSSTLIVLLNRALRDVAFTTFAAKEQFQRAAELSRIVERTCDAAEEGGGERSLVKRNKGLFEQLDKAMDAYVKPILHYTAKAPDPAAVQNAHSDFLAKLKSAD